MIQLCGGGRSSGKVSPEEFPVSPPSWFLKTSCWAVEPLSCLGEAWMGPSQKSSSFHAACQPRLPHPQSVPPQGAASTPDMDPSVKDSWKEVVLLRSLYEGKTTCAAGRVSDVVELPLSSSALQAHAVFTLSSPLMPYRLCGTWRDERWVTAHAWTV